MALCADANRWAPKVVIALQLATWSVVGILLVRRGSMRLRGSAEDRTGSSEIEMQIITSGKDFKSSERASSTLREYDYAARWGERDEDTDTREDEVALRIPNGPLRRISFSRYRTVVTGVTSNDNSDNSNDNNNDAAAITERTRTTKGTERKEPLKKRRKAMGNEGVTAHERVTVGSVEDRSFESTFLWSNERANVIEGGTTVGGLPDVEAAGKIGGVKTRPSRPVSRSGTAAAIVMLAIGIVMLLLGPSIVILRALDARRQRRRLRRLRGRSRRFAGAVDAKDLPPSYEQATLMDQAPRYSTLRLNVLLEPTTSSTSPTSPTSSTSPTADT